MKYFELLSDEMKATLEKAGFAKPTPIQEKTLELIFAQRDIMGIAQTGTGKTAAFAVPIIEKTFVNNRKTSDAWCFALRESLRSPDHGRISCPFRA